MKKNTEFYIRDLTIDDEYDTINANASVKEAALKMKEAAIPDLVVVDNNNKVLGVIADFDIVTNLVAEGLSVESKVTEIMYTIEPVSQNTPVSTAFTRMRDLDVSVIPVIEKDKLLGVATITDCWGFLPEEYEDKKGLIPVSNPRLFNYSFSILMVLFYFIFGILSPLVGISGFLSAPVAGRPGVSAIYYLFEARGGGFLFRYLDFQGVWLILTGYGIVFLILGIFSAFAIFQWAYADYHLVKIKRNWQVIGLVVGIANILVEWMLFIFLVMSGALRVSSTQINLDIAGLLLSGLAIIFLLASVSREIFFRESSSPASKEE
ncbi:MAG: cyclic nucleotide-binding/CBS domain-containing protein [Candidatus Hodarchaeota archaeon]